MKRLPRRAVISLFFAALLCAVSTLPCSAQEGASANMSVLALTRSQALAGAAVMVDGRPVFVQVPETQADADIALVPVPGQEEPLQVSILSDPPENAPQTLVLPVSIEDKVLARGVTLNLLTPSGHTAEVKVPPRRVFISIPFTIPVTSEAHEDFAPGAHDNLIVQVVPKITKKAQVNVDNTATDGVVADIRYEGVAYLRLKDLLNRTNRRDMDGTFFIGKSEDYRWHIITENLFEKFDKRNLAVMRDQRVSQELLTRWRLDNLDNFHAIQLGLNLVYKEDKTRLMVGNIDRRVKDRYHAEIEYGDENGFFKTRFEGIEGLNPSGRSPFAFKADRFGWQAGFTTGGENSYFEGRFGNLKLQNLEDEGEIDDYFNFRLRHTSFYGMSQGPFSRSNFNVNGELDLDFYGIGSATWLQGEMNVNLSLYRDYLLYVRLNDDFARITGTPPRAVWESMFFSFMRNRNYFNSKDPLGRWGFESIYFDVRYQREKKGASYEKSLRFGVSRYLKILNYDIPLEMYLETNRIGKYRPGAAISIRSYL